MEQEEKKMKFVLQHFEEGIMDTAGALAELERKISEKEMPSALTSKKKGGAGAGKRIACFFAAAAAVLVIASAGLWIWNGRAEEYIADSCKNEYRLADSVNASLAPGSKMKVRRNKHKMQVELLEGKAFFDVNLAGGTELTVRAGGISAVEVLGTRFQVISSACGRMIRVDVIDGVVSVDGENVTCGMSAVRKKRNEKPAVFNTEILNPAAWATGMFVYDEAPLDDVLEDLSAFYNVDLRVAGSRERRPVLTGVFAAADDINEVIPLIEEAAGAGIVIIPR